MSAGMLQTTTTFAGSSSGRSCCWTLQTNSSFVGSVSFFVSIDHAVAAQDVFATSAVYVCRADRRYRPRLDVPDLREDGTGRVVERRSVGDVLAVRNGARTRQRLERHESPSRLPALPPATAIAAPMTARHATNRRQRVRFICSLPVGTAATRTQRAEPYRVRRALASASETAARRSGATRLPCVVRATWPSG